MHYEDLIRVHAPAWPYKTYYGKEQEASTDVLILGGGIAGCWAAISAARKGARVIMVEKGATKTSGSGAAGVDHWHGAAMNPASNVTPEELAQAMIDASDGRWCGISSYIKCRESYDCLLDMEKMGVKVRDSEDEFKGAEFRDEKTKLLFAYDYRGKHCVRVWGSKAKEVLHRECRRLGVVMFDHVMVTALLTEGGKVGGRVVGATGFNVRSGEFYTFQGKATILCMAWTAYNWMFSTEIKGLSLGTTPPTLSGDGFVMAWNAGAEFAGLELANDPGRGGPFGYPQYGTGNPRNTWFACSMIDAKGKEIPWVDRDGNILQTVAERYLPAKGAKFFLEGGGQGAKRIYAYQGPKLIPDWAERVKKGEYTLPLYADLPGMPPHERRVIFGLMVAQEGKTLIPVYRAYTQAGFDPDKDLLQAYEGDWFGVAPRQFRSVTRAGLVVDWDLKTNLEGLYTAGRQIFASGAHAHAATTGRYAGRKAADYALANSLLGFDQRQLNVERARVYAPLLRDRGMEWKELSAGVSKVMQDYCVGDGPQNEELLRLGLKWFEELETGEAATARARNPHELMRIHEVFSKIAFGKMIMHGCLAPRAKDRWITVTIDGEGAKTGELSLDYYGSLRENYDAHAGL
jgi:succinate dehydrogenase/fumarate reductase flavoprotein subunit